MEERRLALPALARRFTEEFLAAPHRGYGGAVRDVFQALKEEEWREPLGPAARQFGGSGSYGNGAGMRAHPVAMALVGEGEGRVREAAGQVARITHSHPLGVVGGQAQAVAVYHALQGASPAEVRGKVEELVEDDLEFSMKMGVIHRSLGLGEEMLEEVVLGGEEAEGLGNGVAALHSVPTALYCYLSVLGAEGEGEASEERKQALFEQVITRAIQCGGDTDTIASMAGAIAGAALGQQAVSRELVAACEAGEEIRALATSMWEIVNEEVGLEASQSKKPKM